MPANKSAHEAVAKAQANTIEKLGLTFGEKSMDVGQYVPKAEAQLAPQLSYTGEKGGEYVVVCLDLDAPFASLPVLGPILHWVQSGLKSASDGTLSAEGHPFIADYIGPAPPPLSGPHRYAFFLYEQPDGFDLKKYAPASGQKVGVMSRMRYDLDAFEREAKLGKIIAAHYFVSN